MDISKRCFKIDRPNAMAMIEGFRDNGPIRHQSIWIDVIAKPFPMLVNLQITPARFELSKFGKSLEPEKYSIPLKYIALLDSEYFIKNDMELWNTICTNGLFNIWTPMAPYKRLAQSRSDPSKFRIQLLRIYEIFEEFSHIDIKAVSSRINHLITPKRKVTIKQPIVQDEEFKSIKKLLLDSVSNYLLWKPLEEPGIEVTIFDREPRAFQTWAFCANPKRYRILQALHHVEVDFWTTGKSDVRAGDRVAIWQTRDAKGRRGIIGLGEVLSNPELRNDADNPYWVNPSDGVESKVRVPVRYVHTPNLPLWVDDTPEGKFLNDLSVSRSRGGTVFRIKPIEWERITRLVGGWNAPPLEEVDATENLRQRSGKSASQGFGLNAAERRIVEERAMNLAKAYFLERWENVKDVSATASFDLLCRHGSQELRVEVKGTIGEGKSVVLTKNEVRQAGQTGFALFVVSQIEINRSDPNVPKASGGICRFFDPLDLTKHKLKPLAYTCDLEWSLGRSVKPREKTNYA